MNEDVTMLRWVTDIDPEMCVASLARQPYRPSP